MKIVLCLLLTVPLSAATYTAASASYADVNACVNSGAAATCSPGGTHTVVNGDIVQIPAGTATWTSQLLGPSGVNWQLLGTGTPNSGSGTTGPNSSCANNGSPSTRIVDNYTSSFGMIEMRPSYNASFNAPASRISCMVIDPNSNSTSLWDPIFFLGTCTSSGCPAIRVDNITFGLTNQWSEGGNSSDAEAAVLAEMVFGVLDHNSLCTSGTPCPANTGFELFNAELGVYLGTGQYGDNSWASADSLGTANNLFAENNLDYSNGYLAMNDCEQDDSLANRGGCRFVIRYNTVTVTGTSGGFGIAQNHGTDSGGRARGGRSAEVYGNTFNCHVSSGGCASLEGGLRSGSGIYFANAFSFTGSAASSSSALGLSLYRAEGSWDSSSFGYCGGQGAYDQNNGGNPLYSGTMTTSGSGVLTMTDGGKSFSSLAPSGANYSVCDSTASPSWCSEVVSNTSTTITVQAYLASSGAAAWGAGCNTTSGSGCGFNNGDSYTVNQATICADQPGRGQGSYIFGATPSPTGWVGDTIDPIFRWNESFSGGSPSQPNIYSSVSGRIIAYRDWYDQSTGIQTTSSSPFSCNGSTGGTGWGTLANRPSSCSGACSANSPGCGYWATDANGGSGELYVWQSGAWTPYYTPYTYPHPLDGGPTYTGSAFSGSISGKIQ